MSDGFVVPADGTVVDLGYLRSLYAFNRWANAAVLAAVEGLSAEEYARDLGSSFPSVRDTVVHLLSAEWIWLERWHGNSPRAMLNPPDFADLAAVRARWAEVEEGQTSLLARLTAAELAAPLSYVNTRGERWTYPLWQMLAHVVNHSTYHRGQLVTMLRQLGKTAPSTDLLLFFEQQLPG